MTAIPYIIVCIVLFYLYLNENGTFHVFSEKKAQNIAFILLLVFIGLRGHIYSDFIQYYRFFEQLPNLFELDIYFFSDWYFMSSNAVTEDGTLLNLDGLGNRVASLIFGPDKVLVVVGVNKITSDINEAYRRVREVASPRNAQRFDIGTPCKKTGKCADCLSPDTICCSMVHTRYCKVPGRITVILVDESLGY